MATKLFVCEGAICKCSLQTTPGILKVTSQSIKKLEGKLQATEDDKTFSTPFGACKRSSPPPPCTPNLSQWTDVAKATKVDGKLALLETSKNTCSYGGVIEITNPNQTIGKTTNLPSNEIKNSFQGEVHFRRKLDPSGSYALYPDGLTDVTESQPYGFDWIRDVLDGDESYTEVIPVARDHMVDFISAQIPSMTTIGLNQRSLVRYKGKYAHYTDFDPATRKMNDEGFYFVINEKKEFIGEYSGSLSETDFYNGLINGTGVTYLGAVPSSGYASHSEIIEYNSNRTKKNSHISTSSRYTTILNNIGGSYAAVESSILLTSYAELAKEHIAIKQYINTPDGTERTGNNAGSIPMLINKRSYNVPWLAVFHKETAKINALCFLNATAPAGEIYFESSNTNIQIAPAKINASSLAVSPYPTTTQYSDAIPGSNKVDIEISFTGKIKKNEVVEARFYDNKRKGTHNYKGELIGMLNVFRNDPEYQITFRYVKVCFTDNNGWLATSPGVAINQLPTGASLPAGTAAKIGMGTHTKADQLSRGKDLMDLFLPSGSQDPYLKNLFKQGLMHYNPPTIVSDADAVVIDISEIYSAKPQVTSSGITFNGDRIMLSNATEKGKFSDAIQQFAKNKINASKGNLDGVTVALIPYQINDPMSGLYGVSDGIGGTAKNVYVTYLMYLDIGNDRATAAHEALHSLGLYHSFPDGGKAVPYIISSSDATAKFLNDKTENVMDYTKTAKTIYKWQWEKVQKDLPDVTPKP